MSLSPDRVREFLGSAYEFSPKLGQLAVSRALQLSGDVSNGFAGNLDVDRLSVRQQEMMLNIATGVPVEQEAMDYGVTELNAQKTRSELSRKLRVKGIPPVARLAIEYGLALVPPKTSEVAISDFNPLDLAVFDMVTRTSVGRTGELLSRGETALYERISRVRELFGVLVPGSQGVCLAAASLYRVGVFTPGYGLTTKLDEQPEGFVRALDRRLDSSQPFVGFGAAGNQAQKANRAAIC